MTIAGTCGCKSNSLEDFNTITYKGYDEFGEECEITGTYCDKCIKSIRRDFEVITEFSYPEDRGEIYGEVNEEEAWLYHTLSEFEQIVDKYGAQFVLARMRNHTFDKLSEWFYDAGAEPNQELAWLLKKRSVNA